MEQITNMAGWVYFYFALCVGIFLGMFLTSLFAHDQLVEKTTSRQVSTSGLDVDTCLENFLRERWMIADHSLDPRAWRHAADLITGAGLYCAALGNDERASLFYQMATLASLHAAMHSDITHKRPQS
jgi:hypothetical protein